MRQNQCLINVSHLHCKCTVNSSMLLAFFVSMEILWICLSSHLLSVAPRVLPSASEEQNTENLFRTPAVSRPDPRGRRTKYSDSGVPSSFTPKHKQPETTCHWSFFSFLLLPSHPVSRIFHSTGEIVLYLDSLFSSSFRHLYNYFGATFRRFFSSKSTSDFEVSNLVAPTETTESRRGARVRSFPSAI